jgi:hypothetical protein
MNEPEYAQSRYHRFHRVASLALVLGSLLKYALFHGSGLGIRRHAEMVFPLAMIWFADELAAMAIDASGGWLTPHNADVVLRTCGWILLLLMLAARNIGLFF